MGSSVGEQLRRQVRHRLGVGLGAAMAVSVGLNLLMLTVPLFSMQVYDRVLGSGHGATLVLLCGIGLVALLTLGAFEAVRTSVLARLGVQVEFALLAPLLRAGLTAGTGSGQGLRDLATVRQALGGPAATALFDLPWLPLALGISALLSPWLALFGLGSAACLLGLAALNAGVAGQGLRGAGRTLLDVQGLADAAGRKAEAVRAMGMATPLLARLEASQLAAVGQQRRAAERSGMIVGLTRAVRLAVQSGVLALGAWLVLDGQLTPGGMMAASILLSKALAPVEQMIGTWRTLAAAHESWSRLMAALTRDTDGTGRTSLPRPRGQVRLEGVSVQAPHGGLLLKEICLALSPGQCLAVVGPSGSGKSTLCRVLTGLVAPDKGAARLDGAELQHYRADELGGAIGYLPQEPMLFAGTVRANIARLRPDATDAEVVRAAQLAGAHELIGRLPQGYDTPLGDNGAPLSGGQRQRLGLARALFGRPALVVLDEPNSNLDAAGEAALMATVARLKAEKVAVVLVTHRSQALQQADLLLVLEGGAVGRLGPCREVMASLVRPARAA